MPKTKTPPLTDWRSALEALRRFLIRVKLGPRPRPRRRTLTDFDRFRAFHVRFACFVAVHGARGLCVDFSDIAFTDEDRAAARYWLDHPRLAEALVEISDSEFRERAHNLKPVRTARGPVYVAAFEDEAPWPPPWLAPAPGAHDSS